MIKSGWSHVLAFSAWTLKKTRIVRKPEPRLQISVCKANSSLTEHSLPNHERTLKDILLVSFAITLNHRQTFLLHINTLDCVKAEI